MFYKKCVLKIFAKFKGKHLCQSLSFNKTLLECFPLNFRKFLRTPFLQNTSGRLLLNQTAKHFWFNEIGDISSFVSYWNSYRSVVFYFTYSGGQFVITCHFFVKTDFSSKPVSLRLYLKEKHCCQFLYLFHRRDSALNKKSKDIKFRVFLCNQLYPIALSFEMPNE